VLLRLVRYLYIYTRTCPEKSPIIFTKEPYIAYMYRRWEVGRQTCKVSMYIYVYMSAKEPYHLCKSVVYVEFI